MFKCCPKCGFVWASRLDFLSDSGLHAIGYQVNFQVLQAGIFLFNHVCRGTLGIPAAEFMDLYRGPVFQERATGGAECAGHCLHEDDLAACPAQCECAFVREVLQRIRMWPKRMEAQSSMKCCASAACKRPAKA
jgi:hypothetical protein